MNEHYKFINPPLPYGYDAMEPYIDAKTMELHHDKHLQTYVDNLNKVLEEYPEYQEMSLPELILGAGVLPEEIQMSVKDNAGGVFNHIFYFSNLKNPSSEVPKGALAAYIISSFGSYEAFQKVFTDAALSVFGSGYVWLVTDGVGVLQVMTTANQDTPLTLGLCPILNIDVWEHAYYLKHHNKRVDYIKDWFQIINWEKVNQNLLNCILSKSE